MLTVRDIVVAAIAVTATLACVKLTPAPAAQATAPAQTPPIMTSSVFDWNKIEAKPTKTGATRKFFQAPTPTMDELECHVTSLNPGQVPHAPHKHLDEELVIVKEGTVEALVNNEKSVVGAGSIIFLSSNQEHGLRNAGDTPASYFVVRMKWPGMLRPQAPAKPPQK
jgi:XRE family transcriptional regulator, regulator of sulfur utilization